MLPLSKGTEAPTSDKDSAVRRYLEFAKQHETRLSEKWNTPLTATDALSKIGKTLAVEMLSNPKHDSLFRSLDSWAAANQETSLDHIAAALAAPNPFLSESERKFRREFETLREENETRQRQLAKVYEQLNRKDAEHTQEKAEVQKQVEELSLQLEATKQSEALLLEKEKVGFLLSRVHPDAKLKLMESVEFQDQFLAPQPRNAFVMSVDIRRSTDLMLKAEPENFAAFVTQLCEALRKVTVSMNGIFDKFTGDGILAFFPEFYSGDDAGYYAISAAMECHRVFKKHYENSRHYFDSVLTNTGLGIGIDYGSMRLVRLADGLSVVGKPVVYACRMGGTEAGTTVVNQPAYNKLTERYKDKGMLFKEHPVVFKNKDTYLGYSVTLTPDVPFTPQPPAWNTVGDSTPADTKS